jgi:O-antigen ligase
MAPPLAALIFFIGIVGLFWLDRQDRIAKANVVPFLWLFIAMSRPVTSWTSTGSLERAEAYLEGSPIDRSILTVLIALAIGVLWRRRPAVAAILRSNTAVIVFFAYCMISIAWSDYPFVASKRWIRGVADVLMILVILTDRHPEAALQSIMTRVGYVLVPLSILFIRFYPELGRVYSIGGKTMWTGVGTDKNALGALCLIVGSVVLWRLMNTIAARQRNDRWQELLALTTVLGMIVYLLSVVDSKTAQMCFGFASVVIIVRGLFRRPWAIFMYTVGAVAACYAVLIAGVAGDSLLEAIGREATLTGRTAVWERVLRLVQSPWFGSGYESFWLGPRLRALTNWGGNQAHNGYLEVYVNLGWIGWVFLGAVIVVGYRHMIAACRANPNMATLRAAFFVICMTYNYSEAAFKMMSPVWLMFLWATIAAPVSRLVPVSQRDSVKPFVRPSFVPNVRVKTG